MKERLDQFTMSQFIDIACGNYSHIGADGETAKRIASKLLEQYNNISDPASAKSRLLDEEKLGKSSARVKMYRILLNLINIYGAYEAVRNVLTLSGQTNIAKLDDDGIKAKLEQLLRSEESQQEREAKERQNNPLQNVSEEEVRASFDQQTAWLMTHFKFSISHEAISASVYANLVNTACRQHRRQNG